MTFRQQQIRKKNYDKTPIRIVRNQRNCKNCPVHVEGCHIVQQTRMKNVLSSSLLHFQNSDCYSAFCSRKLPERAPVAVWFPLGFPVGSSGRRSEGRQTEVRVFLHWQSRGEENLGGLSSSTGLYCSSEALISISIDQVFLLLLGLRLVIVLMLCYPCGKSYKLPVYYQPFKNKFSSIYPTLEPD